MFLTVGHQELNAFAQLDLWFLVRTIEPPVCCRCAMGSGSPGADRSPSRTSALLRTHAIDVLVTKASGGDATYAKLAAARATAIAGGHGPATAAASARWSTRSKRRWPGSSGHFQRAPAGRSTWWWSGAYRRLSAKSSLASAPDQDQRGAGDLLAAHAPGSWPGCQQMTRWSGQETRYTTTIGQSAPQRASARAPPAPDC